MSALTSYDDLYVISDLHMGGRPGFQIMNRGERLARFIRAIVPPERPAARRVGLVINGDVIDTLAEEFDGYIAAVDAARILERLYADAAFAPVWTALAAFVQQGRGHLIFVLGNHDLELALPGAQRSIRARLAGDDDAAAGRIAFAVDGAGYACRVGGARVFCTHGNEVDAWNVVDYDSLRRLARDDNAGLPFDASAWTPNAGTRLVRDVINRVKRRWPWIELLKPERNVLLGVLLTIDPGTVRYLPSLLPVAWARGAGELRRRDLLSVGTGDPVATIDPEQALWTEAIGPQLQLVMDGMAAAPPRKTSAHDRAPAVDPMLLDIERHLASGEPPRATIDDLTGTLGWRRMVVDRLQSVDAIEALRRALVDWQSHDRSFDLADQDETCQRILRTVGPDVDIVVTGHTHLERAIVTPPCAYYNTGTWTRLLRLPDPILQDARQFDALYKLLHQATVADLDAARLTADDGTLVPVLADTTTALHVSAQGDAATAWLGHVVDDAHHGVRFERIPQSDFQRH